jgi:DNA-binding MarR family transcriptional regulator
MSITVAQFDLERYLPYRLTVIAGQLSAEMAKQYKERHGISMAEWRVLLSVGYSKKPSIRDIEKKAGLEKSKVSRAASRLQANGFLIKHIDDQDRRLLKLSLTKEGRALLDNLIPIAQEFQVKLDEKLGAGMADFHACLDILTVKTSS